ncbi:MAG: type II secretion system F family protein [Oscillospiraceae bacterium]|nr:type II secretion system F family protein [Oscillospiraceae bacterium]
MAVFSYIAMDSSGKRVENNIAAETKQDVVKFLSTQNLYPIKISEGAKVKGASLLDFKNPLSKITGEDLYLSCRQFYVMLHAGISILDCLETVAQQALNPKMRDILHEVHEMVAAGTSFSGALEGYKNDFPSLYVSMIETGEVTGNLEEVMRRLAEYYENEYKTVSQVKSAMIYPTVLLILTVVMVAFILMFVMPTFVEIFEDTGAELPALTKGLMTVSNMLVKYWYLVFGGIAILVALCTRISRLPMVRLAFDRLKLRIPVVKNVEMTGMTFRSARSLAIMLASGVSLVDALVIVSRVAGNVVGRDAFVKVRQEISQGVQFGKAMERAGLFPSMYTSMIKIGEASGAIDGILDDVADYYQEELNTCIRNLVSVLEPLMIVVMAGCIGTVALAILMPMFTMTEAIG